MGVPKDSIERIGRFLAHKRIALVGVSRAPAELSSKLFEEFRRRGYDAVPVNPNATEILGRRCYARVQEIDPPVDAVLLMTSPEVTEEVVRDCAAAGIKYMWMYRGTGKGAGSELAVEFCRENGMQVVSGQCPFMFLPETEMVHRLHGFFRKITGRYPQGAGVAAR